MEKVLFLSDILPTGWMAAENCNIKPGDTVAIWGAGPVGQMTIVSAWALGAGRVIVVDDVPERLELARSRGKAETIDFGKVKVFDRMQELTGGRGPDSCVDAVGLEAHGWTVDAAYDRMKTSTWLATDRLHVLREIIWCCRKAGTLSVPGVYAGFLDKLPFGAAFAKGLTIKTGQTHVQKYLPSLLAKIESGELDPSFIITHRVKLDEAPEMYKTFRDRKDGCIKVVMAP